MVPSVDFKIYRIKLVVSHSATVGEKITNPIKKVLYLRALFLFNPELGEILSLKIFE